MMSGHPLNLVARFLLELAAWGAMGYWGWTQHEGFWRVVAGLGAPLLAMALWGLFRVPGDPGAAPVAVSGRARLALEWLEFGAAALLLVASGQAAAGAGLSALVSLHYALSHDRVRWMLAGEEAPTG